MKKIKNKYFISLIISLLICVGIKYLSRMENYYNIVFLFLFIGTYYFSLNIIMKKKDKWNIVTFIFSLISTIICIFGQEIYCCHSLDNFIKYPLTYLLSFIGIMLLYYLFFEFIKYFYNKVKDKMAISSGTLSRRTKKIGMYGIIITHMICYLSYFPGMYDYDIQTQVSMLMGAQPLSNYQPIVHTYIWFIFSKIQDFLHIEYLEVILYSIFQLSVVLITYFYFLRWCEKRKANKKLILFSYLYFALNPVLIVFSLCTTKDVLFSMFLFLFLTSLVDIYENQNKRNTIKYIVFGIFACLFRNNMLYVFIVFLGLLLIFLKNKKITLGTVIIVTTVYCFTNFLCPAVGVKKGPMQEMLSIPLSQMSYVYLYEKTYTKKEKELISEYVPYISKYNPRRADFVKYNFKENKFRKNKKEFINLYLKGLRQHPIKYFVVFLDMNVCYWYPNARTIDAYSMRRYIEDGSYLYNKYSIKHNNIFPFNYTYKFFNNIAQYKSAIYKIPVLANYFLLSFNFWLLLTISYLYFSEKRDKQLILVVSILMLLFLTYMFGPLSNFRYIYPFYVIEPLLVVLLFSNNKKTVNLTK